MSLHADKSSNYSTGCMLARLASLAVLAMLAGLAMLTRLVRLAKQEGQGVTVLAMG